MLERSKEGRDWLREVKKRQGLAVRRKEGTDWLAEGDKYKRGAGGKTE